VTIPVTITGELRLPLASLPRQVLDQLRRELSFRNPAYIKAERAGRSTYGIDQVICGVEQRAAWGGPDLVLPRGCLPLLTSICLEARLQQLEVTSLVREGATLPRLQLQQQLRPYQQPAVRALVAGVQGMVVAPCGSGKTQIGVAAIAEVGRSALVLVHTKDLLQQWLERIRLVLEVEAGVIGEGKREVRAITVATVQTLAKLTSAELQHVGRSFGVVCVDECHHGPARLWYEVLGQLPARWRWGLTATPERDDGLTPMLGWLFGPVLHSIGQAELIRLGHLVVPDVVTVLTGWSWDGDPVSKYNDLLADLTTDGGRNALICDLAQSRAQRGTVLVLSQRKAHCDGLAEQLRCRDVRAEVLTSQVGRRRRTGLLDELRAGTLPVLCATQLADEGLDLPGLETVILACPGRAIGRTIQRLGRIMRPHPGKGTPVLYDLVDDVGLLGSQARSRQRAYRQVLGTVRARTISATAALEVA
jgi:superfamily II DNA or RNA helicase